MASFEELYAAVTAADNEPTEPTVPARGATGIGDYAQDIVRAPIKGASRAVQALVTMGALPIDYLANTNLIATIDNYFDKITPETKTGIGDIAATLTQFIGPTALVTRLAGGMKFLSGLTEARKLSSITSLGGKTAELVRRGGYYGAIGGISDFVASVPGRDKTLTETFGLTEEPTDIREMTGSERAAETLKEKLKFGAEGTVLGGAIPLLPAAGTIGFKYGILPAAKGVAIAGTPVLKAVNYTVFNPLSKMIAGVETPGLIPKLVTKGGELIETALEKTGIPAREDWKFSSYKGDFGDKVLRGLDSLLNKFTSAGPLGPTMKNLQQQAEREVLAKRDTLLKITDDVDRTLYDLNNDFKVKLYDSKESMFALQMEKNKIFDYITAKDYLDPTTGINQAERAFNQINPAVQNQAKKLKDILKEANEEYGSVLAASKQDSYQAIGRSIIADADNYLKQRFAAYGNAKFKFDPTLNKEAIKVMENTIESNPQLLKIVEKVSGTADKNSAAFKQRLEEYAKIRLENLKKQVIYSDRSPESITNMIAKNLGTNLEKGILKPDELLPDAIKKLFSSPEEFITSGGKRIPVTDYRGALVDTITQQSKDIYKKLFFDEFEKFGLKNNLVFRNLDEAAAKGKSILNLQTIQPRGPDYFFQDSNLFKYKDPISQMGYYTTPEIANALLESKAGLDRLFDLPFYKSIMAVKSGAQIAKTIFSPVTQVRNYTTSSFFPLASGLIGGRVSLKDSWKIIAEDIFNSAKTDKEGIANYIEDAIKRGVIDQNIEVNELRTIITRAGQGKMNFETFMNTPLVKKLTDIYQGSDNYWKVYADRFYQAALKPAIRNMDDVKDWYRTVAKEEFITKNTFTGMDKTLDDALKEISSYLVTNTIPTYSKVPQIIQNIRLLPLGNFVAFPAEILRTSANLLSLGARELTSSNAFVRQMGARRLIGMATTFGGIGTVAQQTAQALTGVNQDAMDAYQRSFAPQYEKNSTLIPLSAPDSKGDFKYTNFSYSNPYNSILQPINAVLKAYGDGVLNQDSVDKIIMNALFYNPVTRRPGALTEFFTPFIDESIGTERALDIIVRGGETRTGKKIYYSQDSLSTRISKGLGHLFEALEPGAVTSAKRIYDGATGRFTDAGTIRDSADELTALMSGVRVSQAKPLSSMPFIITSFNRDKQEIGGKFSSVAYSPSSSQEEKISAYKDFILESYDAQNRLYQTLKDAQTLGVGDSSLREILNQRMTKSDARNLLTGTFKVPNYSNDRFKALVQRLNQESSVSGAKIESQISNVKDIYRDLQNDLRGYSLGTAPGELENRIDRLLTPSVSRTRGVFPYEGPITPIRQQVPTRQSLPTGLNTSSNINPQAVQNINPSIGDRYLAEYQSLFKNRGVV
jgi:hypothetical protein